MQCPNCGRYIREESTICEYCGRSVRREREKEREKERMKEEKDEERGEKETEREGVKKTRYILSRKYVAAIFLGAVLVLSLVHFLQYETEDADTLVRAARKEMERGSELLHKVETELHTLREVQLEALDEVVSEKNYASQSKEVATSILIFLDEAEPHFEKAVEFLEKTEKLRLPGWYREYVNREKEITQIYNDYTTTLRTLAANVIMYYGFAEQYLTGEQLLINLMNDIDRGNDHLERGDYAFAFAAYESASDQAKEAQEAYKMASKMIDLPYISDFLSNLTYLERALFSLSEAAHQMELGNTEEASALAALGAKELASMIHVNRLQLKAQASEWYKTHVTEVEEELKKLQSEIEQLAQDER